MDKTEVFEQELAVLRLHKKQLEDLLLHPGWQLLQEAVKAGIRGARQEIFSKSVISMDAAFEVAQGQGRITGMAAMAGLPGFLIDDLSEDLQRLLASQEEKGG